MEEGIVPGGGSALISASKAVQSMVSQTAGDVKTGVSIVLRALEEPVRQGVAFDSACDRAVCVARRLPVRLPAEAEIQIDAGFEAENEGELNIRFDGLALLVFLRGVGLHGEDVVLVFRAVR